MKTALAELGITTPDTFHHNLSAGRLVEEAIKRREGKLSR